MNAIETSIESSKALLDLLPDWDDEGALPIEADTLARATALLRTMIEASDADTAPAPDISACNDGSVDLFWRTERFTLAVNVAPQKDTPPDFHFANSDSITFSGRLRERP